MMKIRKQPCGLLKMCTMAILAVAVETGNKSPPGPSNPLDLAAWSLVLEEEISDSKYTKTLQPIRSWYLL
jgi:hypothetical protein